MSTQHIVGWPSTDQEVLVETVAGSDRPAHYFLAETLDDLYTPYALRLPAGPGPHPFVCIAYGNGGGGMTWLRDRVHRYRHITDVLLDAGYACAWSRYRTEVELGYQNGGALHTDLRQGMGLLNRAPLEYEDEVAILRHVARAPGHRCVPAVSRWRQPCGRDALQAPLALPGSVAGRRRGGAGQPRVPDAPPRR